MRRFFRSANRKSRQARRAPVKKWNSGSFSRRLNLEFLEERTMLVADGVSNYMSLDVSRDGHITALDAVLIINDLNANGSRRIAPAQPSSGAMLAGSSSMRALMVDGAMSYVSESMLALDVNGDSYITALDAALVINELNALAAEPDDLVQFRVEVTNPGGTPITEATVGDNFVLNVYVKDLRTSGSSVFGVIAAFTDVTYTSDDGANASVSGAINRGTIYTQDLHGSTATPGLLDEVGGLSNTFTPLGTSERLVFSVPFTATAAGILTFAANQADDLPTTDTILYADVGVDPKVDPENIFYGDPVTLTITDLPSMSIDNVTVNEASGTATFTVTMAPTTETVTVNFTTQGGSATEGDDYEATSGVLTFLPSANPQTMTIPVTITNDQIDENDETFLVLLSGAVNASVADPEGQGTIIDDEGPASITISDVSTTEGNAGTKTFTFNVNLSAASGQQITVNYSTAPGSATAGNDFETESGSVTFTPGQTTQPITITVNGDELNELDETFFVNLSDATNATISDPQGLGTIQNDDALPTVSIVATRSVGEPISGTTTLEFIVSLNNPSGRQVTVPFLTAGGSATQDSDYVGTSGQLVFDPGDVSESITVTINSDGESELDETFFVNLGTPINANLGNAQSIATITDVVPVDKEVRLRLETTDLDGNPIAAISGGEVFRLNVFVKDLRPVEDADGVFQAYLDILFDPALIEIAGSFEFGDDYPNQHRNDLTTPGLINETGASADVQSLDGDERLLFSVNVRGIGGGVANFSPNEADNRPLNDIVLLGESEGTPPAAVIYAGTSITITPPPTLTINNQTIVEGNNGQQLMQFTVTLNPASDETVTVDFTTVPGTATAGADYTTTSGTLSFNPLTGETTKTIQVPILGDLLDEVNETFIVRLSNADGAVIPFGGGDGTGTITDNDDTPTLSVSEASGIEGGNAVFTVTLSAASGRQVQVNYSTTGQTATQGTDYTGVSNTLTFAPGEVSKTISVPLTSDQDNEGAETFALNLSAPVNATILDGQGIGTINDAPLASLAGIVYFDFDESGDLSDDDFSLVGIEILLTGTDELGNTVSRKTTTRSDGSYRFRNLLPGTYTITQVQPSIIVDGADFVGSMGEVGPHVNDQFTVIVQAGQAGTGYNFSEVGLLPDFFDQELFYASSRNGRNGN